MAFRATETECSGHPYLHCRGDVGAGSGSAIRGWWSSARKGVTPAVCRSVDGSGVFKTQCTPAVGQMPSISHRVVANHLTSYLQATGSLADTIDLYDWNTWAGAALHEYLSRGDGRPGKA